MRYAHMLAGGGPILAAASLLALTTSCDEPGSPVSNELGELITPDRTVDAPAAVITRPVRATAGEFERAQVPSSFRVQWSPVPAGEVPIVGYQLKLIGPDISHPDDLVLSFLLHTLPGGTSDIRRPNLLIPGGFAVEEPEPGEPFPPLVSNDHYYETDWWPHLDDLYPESEMVFTDLPAGAYALAVRAVDEKGHVTPADAFAIASAGVEGNVTRLGVVPSLPAAPYILLDNGYGTLEGGPGSTSYRIEIPEGLPLTFTWQIDADWYGYDPGPSRIRIACDGCDGEWSEWGDPQEIDFDIPESAVGNEVVVTLQGRDERDDEAHQSELVLTLEIIALPFDRPALLVDDYVAAGVRDCDQDAVLRDLIAYAVEPYLDGDELALLDAHVTPDECIELSALHDVELSLLARFRTLFWNVAAGGSGSLMGRFTDPSPFAEHGDWLSIYVRGGGNLVVWGRNTIGAMLGDFYPSSSAYIPDLPPFADPNFGPGTFVWDHLRLRVKLDRVARGTAPALGFPCAGIVGLEATGAALSLGFPEGALDPTGYDPAQAAIWKESWTEGYHNPLGSHAEGPVGDPPLDDPYVEPLYTHVSNSWAWADDPASVCGTPFGSPFQGQPVAVRVLPVTGSASGKIVWIGTELWRIAETQPDELRDLMRAIADWLYE